MPHPQVFYIKSETESLRQEIIEHPLYAQIQTLEDVQIFMQNHIFAVWDFMSLLKSLQIHLTCVDLPWRPVGSANTRSLINEIVMGEESDVDQNGNRLSHFEMYLQAMQQMGAPSTSIRTMLQKLDLGLDVLEVIEDLEIHEKTKNFIRFTFEAIAQGKIHKLCAIFTFGREDLIPEMFLSLVRDLNQKFPQKMSGLKYYLERHIEVDGDRHGPLALEMTENVCGESDKNWDEALIAVKESIRLRKELWDGILEQIQNQKKN